MQFDKTILHITKMYDMLCILMNLWGVAVLELDSHPDRNKRADHTHCACSKTNPLDNRA